MNYSDNNYNKYITKSTTDISYNSVIKIDATRGSIEHCGVIMLNKRTHYECIVCGKIK